MPSEFTIGTRLKNTTKSMNVLPAVLSTPARRQIHTPPWRKFVVSAEPTKLARGVWIGTEMKHCENCGLPEWAVTGDGYEIVVEEKPENRFQRSRKRTVWCHSEECAIQMMGLSKYGRETRNWPVTLAQLRPLARKQLAR